MRASKTPRERVTIEDAVPITGLSARTMQEMAARGLIPGAAKLGRRWTFDLHKLRKMIEAKEQETWQRANVVNFLRASSGAAQSFGAASKLAVGDNHTRWEQITRRSRKRVLKNLKQD